MSLPKAEQVKSDVLQHETKSMEQYKSPSFLGFPCFSGVILFRVRIRGRAYIIQSLGHGAEDRQH